MLNNDRLFNLEEQRETLDQLRLDLDPSKPAFWEVAAQMEAIDKTIALLRPGVEGR